MFLAFAALTVLLTPVFLEIAKMAIAACFAPGFQP
jgi:hypothetical protein